MSLVMSAVCNWYDLMIPDMRVSGLSVRDGTILIPAHPKTMPQHFDKVLFFQALADPTRLRLIHLMGDDEICVCFLVEVLQTNQPKISRHLAYLRDAGVVEARRDGKWMHYRLVEPPDAEAARVFRGIRDWLAADEDMRRDRLRLTNICCAISPPVHLRRAPRPASLEQSKTGNCPAGETN